MSDMFPRPAIQTLSLGRPEVGHDIFDKIRAAKNAGFQGIEISYFCLAEHAKQNGESLQEAAHATRALLDELELEVVSLSPLMNFEGFVDRSVHAERLELAKSWLELARILGAPVVQIPACMMPDISLELSVADLIELCDLAGNIGILYEFTSWSTLVRTWQECIQVALEVDRPNFTICLDAFHIGTFHYPLQFPTPHTASKFTLYQLTDAAPVPDPLPKNQPAQDPNAPGVQTMSRTNRPFPFTSADGLLPVADISRTVWNLQKNSKEAVWWSMEVFDPLAWSEDKSVPEKTALIGWKSWQQVIERL
ncbi:xylose isomerase-like protein [Roridomyces roridus]|uniref:Xylose isomerase-like protein n=1 Tax=Roridomyces roridus TaxID=1738132 RepID=A0AAD7FMA7_9AGAR|nr:xylose isomerase-like protein [Roridomyces roridus]